MKQLSDIQNFDEFFRTLSSAPRRMLLLDYDGTLAPFVVNRDQAVPYDGIRERLELILTQGTTRLVIVSGRWSKHLIPLLAIDPLPEIWGCHGAERVSPDGSIELTDVDESSIRGLVAADEWAGRNGLRSLIERKPTSLAFHWRGLDTNRVPHIRDKINRGLKDILEKHRLTLHKFDGGLELRVPDIDKGKAVARLLEEANLNTAIAYLGDDLTDEDAFRALSGRGLCVLVRPEPRDTAADLWLKPPEELLQFLDRWLDNAAD